MNTNFQKSTLNFLHSLKPAELHQIGQGVSQQLSACVQQYQYQKILLVYPADFEPVLTDFIKDCLQKQLELYILVWYEKSRFTYYKVESTDFELEYFLYTKQPVMTPKRAPSIIFDLVILPVMNYDHLCNCLDYDLQLNYDAFYIHHKNNTKTCGYATCFQEYSTLLDNLNVFQVDYVANEFRLLTNPEPDTKKR